MRLPTDLSEHVEGLREALSSMVHTAGETSLDASVPTCPEWTLRELLAHQGMVHRWARAHLSGADTSSPEHWRAEGLAVADPVRWVHDGGLELIDAIWAAPEDLEAPVFLKDAPTPRHFWARRQCHETTIHAVDALAARLARMPRAEETWISREIAADGIDELLTGFLTRRGSGLRSEQPIVFGIRPTDLDLRWTVEVSDQPAVTVREERGKVDVELKAPVVALYLTLWNRSDEVDAPGMDVWHERAKVTWS